jgi:hypothetical protein
MGSAIRRLLASGLLSVAVLCLLAASSASAATLNVVGGQLLGASGVDVGGTLYDVEFLDGTCVGLYSGCDMASDFTFTTQADAVLASQALFDQVFLDGVDLFDTDPELTTGCTDTAICNAQTPWTPDEFAISATIASRNRSAEERDAIVTSTGFSKTDDTTTNFRSTWAVWSPAAAAPVPGPGALVGLGLIAATAVVRRR